MSNTETTTDNTTVNAQKDEFADIDNMIAREFNNLSFVTNDFLGVYKRTIGKNSGEELTPEERERFEKCFDKHSLGALRSMLIEDAFERIGYFFSDKLSYQDEDKKEETI